MVMVINYHIGQFWNNLFINNKHRLVGIIVNFQIQKTSYNFFLFHMIYDKRIPFPATLPNNE